MNLPESFYEGTVIRPPSEAESLILQITLGCTDNSCIFCPAYKDKKFKVKDMGRIENEIKQAAMMFPDTRRIFFADGDAIAMEQAALKHVFELVNYHFRELSRVGIYGSVKSLEHKSLDDLAGLKLLKLRTVYLGFETGDAEVYKMICKHGSPEGNAAACLKLKAAGLTTNVTVILGLGGKDMSRQHAVNTAKILNRAQPDQIAALTLIIAEGTKLNDKMKRGDFKPLADFDFLEELELLLENMEDFRCQFFANHASNYFPIKARFPRDKAGVIASLRRAIGNREKSGLTPEWLRGL